MKATLEKEFPGIEVEIIESSGGAFEVTADGKLVFSKLELGRFPQETEIVDTLR